MGLKSTGYTLLHADEYLGDLSDLGPSNCAALLTSEKHWAQQEGDTQVVMLHRTRICRLISKSLLGRGICVTYVKGMNGWCRVDYAEIFDICNDDNESKEADAHHGERRGKL